MAVPWEGTAYTWVDVYRGSRSTCRDATAQAIVYRNPRPSGIATDASKTSTVVSNNVSLMIQSSSLTCPSQSSAIITASSKHVRLKRCDEGAVGRHGCMLLLPMAHRCFPWVRVTMEVTSSPRIDSIRMRDRSPTRRIPRMPRVSRAWRPCKPRKP